MTGAVKVGTMRGLQHLVGAREWLNYGVQVPQSQDLHLHVTHREGRHKINFLTTWHHSFWSDDYESPSVYLNGRRGDLGQSQNGVNARMMWVYASPVKKFNNALSISLDQLNYQQSDDQNNLLRHNLSQVYIADRFKLRLNKPLWLSAGLEQQLNYSYLTHAGASLWSDGMGRAARRLEPGQEREDDFFA